MVGQLLGFVLQPMQDPMSMGWPQSAPVLDQAALPKLVEKTDAAKRKDEEEASQGKITSVAFGLVITYSFYMVIFHILSNMIIQSSN